MQYLLDQKQMQELDRYSIEKKGVSGLFLMEQAARSVADFIAKHFQAPKSVLIVVESGNNGGDGLALARMLKEIDYNVVVYHIQAIRHTSASFEEQLALAQKKEVTIVTELPTLEQYDIVVDGIFGVGLRKQVRGEHAKVIKWMNRLPGVKIAIDLPSGVHASTGEILGVAFRADYTITFGYQKIGLTMYPGAQLAGEIIVADIGFPEESLWHVKPEYMTFGKSERAIEELHKYIPKRPADSNKGTFGHVLLVAGSKGMAGAAIFAAKAAYKMGCGLVRIITHESNRLVLQMSVPEAVVLSYGQLQDAYNLLDENWQWADAVMVGSGLGLSDLAVGLTRAVVTYASEKKGPMPVVVDGDSLRIIAEHKEILMTYAKLKKEYRSYLVLTPHLKEMSRLCDCSVSDVKKQQLICATDYIEEKELWGNMVLVLKDSRTIVTDGQKLSYINSTGNEGMATAGSGDVLAGMIVSVLAQNNKHKMLHGYLDGTKQKANLLPSMERPLWLAVCIAVCIHGVAGDVAKKKVGSVSLMASDLLDAISDVTKKY